MNLILKNIIALSAILIASLSLAQQTPCTAVAANPTTDGLCSLSGAITAPATVNTWSTNGSGGVTSGLVNTCNATQTAASGNLWFTYTAPASGSLNLLTNFATGGGANIQNPEWQIYQQTGGSCGSSNLTLNYLGCGASGTQTTTTLTPGATYYIRLYDDNIIDRDISGEKYKYCFAVQAANGSCATAQSITPGTPVSGSTLGSTLSDPPFNGGGWCPTGTVWYTFNTGASPGCYSFYYQNATTGCNYVTVYSGGCPGSGGTLINNNVSTNAYNDQGSSEPGFGGMLPNTTYTVAVSNATPNSTFSFNVQPNVATAPNDQCANPIPINTTAINSDNAVAGCEYSYVAAQDANVTAANLCAGTLENISWFQFVALNTGAPIVITFANISCNNGGGGFQTGLFTGSNCSSLTATGVCAAGASGTVTYTIPAGSVVAGNTYYIAMDGNAGSNCHFSVSGTNLAPLPIELINFNIEKANLNEVILVWSTSSEKDNDYFTIERSLDGENWLALGYIDGAGNSNSLLNYRFSDSNPVIGTSYYRLKQTDIDGKESYSSTVSNMLTEFTDFNFKVYPNPSKENNATYIEFSSEKKDEVIFEIIDIKGFTISMNSVELENKTTTIELINRLEKGVYFIRCVNSNGEELTKKFIIN